MNRTDSAAKCSQRIFIRTADIIFVAALEKSNVISTRRKQKAGASAKGLYDEITRVISRQPEPNAAPTPVHTRLDCDAHRTVPADPVSAERRIFDFRGKPTDSVSARRKRT